jgi:hypothetical protein
MVATPPAATCASETGYAARDSSFSPRGRSALERWNLLVAWSLAAGLPQAALADALALLLLALDQQPWRFDTGLPGGTPGFVLKRG